MVNQITPTSPLRYLSVDRSFNDDGEVIFLHLGRGIRKSYGKHRSGVTPEEWVIFANEHLLPNKVQTLNDDSEIHT